MKQDQGQGPEDDNRTREIEERKNRFKDQVEEDRRETERLEELKKKADANNIGGKGTVHASIGVGGPDGTYQPVRTTLVNLQNRLIELEREVKALKARLEEK